MRRIRNGYTLVEVVVSFTLLMVVILGLLQLYPTSFLAHSEAENRIHASQQLESLLDSCSALPLKALIADGQASVGYDPAHPGPLARDLVVTNSTGCEFQPSLEVERKESDDNGRTILVRVVARITWHRQSGDVSMQREQWLSDTAR